MSAYRLETAAFNLQSVGIELRSQSVIAQGVSEGDGESVGGIGLRRAGKCEHLDHHMLHLLFGGLALADHCLLDLKRGVFKHRQIVHDQSGNRRTARLTEH